MAELSFTASPGGSIFGGFEGFLEDVLIPGAGALLGGLIGREFGPGGVVSTDPPGPNVLFPGGTCSPDTFFRTGGTSTRARSEVLVEHPETGRLLVYKNMGRPIAYQGDRAACERMARFATAARRARTVRRSFRRRRR